MTTKTLRSSAVTMGESSDECNTSGESGDSNERQCVRYVCVYACVSEGRRVSASNNKGESERRREEDGR